jgi:hypothetical protein
MIDTGISEILRRKFTHRASELTERGRRRWAASEALELGHGGITVVAQATGVGARTMRRGCQALRHEQASASLAGRRMRHPGGGRTPLQTHAPALAAALAALLDPTPRGDPMSP